jgi:CRP/FNR family transcriptional regulator, nitrogen fixation regulation protein
MIVRTSSNSASLNSVPSGLKALTGGTALWASYKYSQGTQIFRDGEAPKYIYQVREGAVRSYKLLSDGRRQIGAFYLPGDILGVEAESLHRFTAEAIIDTTVWIARRRGPFEGLAEHDLADATTIFELLHNSLEHAQNHLLLLGRQEAHERVAWFLLEMDWRLKKPTAIVLPMSRTDIADYLGLSIETVSRSLSVFRDRGVISFNGQREIILKDRTKLAQVALSQSGGGRPA